MSALAYRLLGRTGVRVSQLCLGTMMFGGPADESESQRMLDRALAAGINFLDTADIYTGGESERVLGRLLGRRREQVVLATKGRQPTGPGVNDRGAGRRHLTRALDASLQRLATDHVDLYYVHAPDPDTPLDETLRALDDFVRAGKVRHLGCSNYRAWQVCEALGVSERLGLNRFACVQPLYNLANRGIEVELLPFCRAHGLGVVSYSPLARGVLTGKYRPGEPPPADSRAARLDKRLHETEFREANLSLARELAVWCERRQTPPTHFALAWCLACPHITSVIVGPRTLAQLEDNLGCLATPIEAEDEAFVDRLVPPGEHSGRGFVDPAYPVTGRGR